MIRYSKPLGSLLSFKESFFTSNEAMLAESARLNAIYASQPRRLKCKNCDLALPVNAPSFVKQGIAYGFCGVCGHVNGAHEDTEAFCQALYTNDHGRQYATRYAEPDVTRFRDRVREVYVPKAQFLKDSILEHEPSLESIGLCDLGAGAGYFVSAAIECGFPNVDGYEPSRALVDFGNRCLGGAALQLLGSLDEIVEVARSTTAAAASLIGVLEHLPSPRTVLESLAKNPSVRYVYLSLPLFSPTVVLEAIFPQVMPRHLAAGHTHLYTELSIEYCCREFGFERASEWWFGLDMVDLYRSVLVSLGQQGARVDCLGDYWKRTVLPLIDELQRVLDGQRLSSEVHLVLKKQS
jgi:hypothetical protein